MLYITHILYILYKDCTYTVLSVLYILYNVILCILYIPYKLCILYTLYCRYSLYILYILFMLYREQQDSQIREMCFVMLQQMWFEPISYGASASHCLVCRKQPCTCSTIFALRNTVFLKWYLPTIAECLFA